MKGKIIGLRTTQGVNSSGTAYSGVYLDLVYTSSDYVGQACKEVYIGSDKPYYGIIAGYLGSNISQLIGADCYIDYDVKVVNGKVNSKILDLVITPVKDKT